MLKPCHTMLWSCPVVSLPSFPGCTTTCRMTHTGSGAPYPPTSNPTPHPLSLHGQLLLPQMLPSDKTCGLFRYSSRSEGSCRCTVPCQLLSWRRVEASVHRPSPAGHSPPARVLTGWTSNWGAAGHPRWVAQRRDGSLATFCSLPRCKHLKTRASRSGV